MSKNFRKFRDFEYDDDYETRSTANQLKVHRKDKRLKNALKARNIDELIDMDDEY
jgi:hypothetical protein